MIKKLLLIGFANNMYGKGSKQLVDLLSRAANKSNQDNLHIASQFTQIAFHVSPH